MQLTQALSLVPPREQKQDDGSGQFVNPHMQYLSAEDVHHIISLQAPRMDIRTVEFTLPKIMEFYSQKSANDDDIQEAFRQLETGNDIRGSHAGSGSLEIENAMHGVLEDLEFGEALDAQKALAEEGDSLMMRIAKWAVEKLMKFAVGIVWKSVWWLIKWVFDKIIMGGIKLLLEYLVRPLFTEIIGFIAFNPEVWPLVALGTLGAVGIGALVFDKLFKKGTADPAEEKDTFNDALDTLLGQATPAGGVAEAGPPVSVGAPVAPATGLADLLTRGESRGSNPYNVVNRGEAHGNVAGTEDLENMTITEVMQHQANHDFNAAGRYQIIGDTLKGAVRALRLNGNELFDRNMQDRIFNDYLIGSKHTAIENYLSGKSDDLIAAAYAVSQEWASAAVPPGLATQSGKTAGSMQTYYDKPNRQGKVVNRASLSAEQVEATLQLERQRRLGLGATTTDVTPVTVKSGAALPATSTGQIKQQAQQSGSTAFQMPPTEPTIIKDNRGNLVAVAM
jgi:muramidase (phage lysozyme)